jgi:branched-chain amino acid aminotransferase
MTAPKKVPAPESDFIWLNGGLVPWREARIHVLSHVIHYGSGVFEGIRAYATPNGPAVLGLRPHVRRFFDSCKIVEMPLDYSIDDVEGAILETIRANRHECCYIRPFAWRGYGPLGVDPAKNPIDVAIATLQWGTLLGEAALTEGVDVGVSSWRRMAPDTHPAMAKVSGNYVNSQLVVREAKRHGYAEGIVLDVAGYVAEGSGENVFFVHEGGLHTPPIGESILPGITRGYVMRLATDLGIPVTQRRLPREMLYIADEIFLTGTAAEITPVRSVDRKPVGNGKRGPVTASLQNEFFSILRGEADDRYGWLTHVNER